MSAPRFCPCSKAGQCHFVVGNMDACDPFSGEITDPRHTLHDQRGELEIEGCRVAFMHGHDVKLLRHTIQSGQWDLLCYGHTHAFSASREGRTLVLNPGALSRTRSPSMAVVELPSMEVQQISL